MRSQVSLYIAAAVMLVAAVLLVAGVGTTGLWIAVIAVGVAVVAFNRLGTRQM